MSTHYEGAPKSIVSNPNQQSHNLLKNGSGGEVENRRHETEDYQYNFK